MALSTVTSKGQTTIPKEIRKYLKLQTGDKIDFIIEEEGRVVIEPATIDVKDLEGLLQGMHKKTISLKEMKMAIQKRFKKKR